MMSKNKTCRSLYLIIIISNLLVSVPYHRTTSNLQKLQVHINEKNKDERLGPTEYFE